MTKDEVLSEIRRMAGERGGRVGLTAFLKATGIPQSQILGKHWATWNEALTDAGISITRFGQAKTEETSVLEAVAQLIARLRKWPTQDELTLARRRDSSFPGLFVIRRLQKSGGLAAAVLAHCANRPDLEPAAKIAAMQPISDSDDVQQLGRALIQGYVYMMSSGRRYKIGHTNSPARRHREVRLDLPDPTNLVHSIETDDPSGIEAYWHRRFAAKRIRDTEFFTLDATDVAAFKRRKSQ